MRIARYKVDDKIRFGIVELESDGAGNPDTVADLTSDPLAGPVNLTGERHALAEVRLLAPVLPRSKVIGIAKNSVPGQDTPPAPSGYPAIFLKPNTSVIGPEDPIVVPEYSKDTRLEGELAIVIGRIAKSVPLERVPEVIFGYTITNDVTAFDLIEPGNPWGMAKCYDSFTPLGPWIVTHLSIEEASSLAIRTTINEELATAGNVRGLIRGIAPLVSFVSSMMTLLPGDVILTAAPGGSTTILPGQRVEVDIEEIGTLGNSVIEA
jgi:2-keto-4-pentenoate hydratase/2-oxohepta-3-ene-1,7-dioic acid hydratase in catechol pathway